MPYLRRYVTVARLTGITAYDIYETMNRQEYFRQSGAFAWDAVDYNLRQLSRVRAGEAEPLEVGFFCPYPTERTLTGSMKVITPNDFWRTHGVPVDMAIYDESVWEQQAIEAANTIEDAHLLWNLWDDGEASQAPTIALDQDEMEEFMNDPLMEFEDPEIENENPEE